MAVGRQSKECTFDTTVHHGEGNSQSTTGPCRDTNRRKEQAQNPGGEDASAATLPNGASGSSYAGESCAEIGGSATETNLGEAAPAWSKRIRHENGSGGRSAPTYDPWQTNGTETQRVARTQAPCDNREGDAERICGASQGESQDHVGNDRPYER
jgi:hypothetical protein